MPLRRYMGFKPTADSAVAGGRQVRHGHLAMAALALLVQTHIEVVHGDGVALEHAL